MKIHLIPNAHIDPVWLWDKYEGIDEVLNTFRSVCNRLDDYPDLTFCASSAQFYEWVFAYDRALFERIRDKVAQGRWEVVGGWWIEPDSNLPGESSFRKQAELACAFNREHFGKNTEVAYLPDTFGHPATLPKILAQAGFKYFLFCRPNAREKPELQENLFYWEYGGHRVLCFRPRHYGGGPVTKRSIGQLGAALGDPFIRRHAANALLFGVGNHGGGPSVAQIECVKQYMREHPSEDMGYSSCLRFFEEAAQSPDIPTYVDENLHQHAVGCYSVLRPIKALVRESERALLRAERALALNGTDAARLAPLWKTTLLNQFHDILPGTCSPAASDQARRELGGVAAQSRDIVYAALKPMTMAAPVSTREGEFRIFNTLPFAVTVPLSIESMPYFKENAVFRDGQGNAIAIQQTLGSVRSRCSHRWEFVDRLPARGFKSYAFEGGALPDPREHATVHFVPGTGVEMDELTVRSGESITHQGVPLFSRPITYCVLADDSDTWGHGVQRYEKVTGAFELESSSVQCGPVTCKLHERWRYGASGLDAVYALYEGMPGVYLDLTVNWAEHRGILKMEVPCATDTPDTFTMRLAAGTTSQAADGKELPLHEWLHLPGVAAGTALLQDGAFACDNDHGRLRITLVRSSVYGFHDPAKLDPHDPQQDTDQGVHRYSFCILPHQPPDEPELDRLAAAFLEPVLVFREGVHE